MIKGLRKKIAISSVAAVALVHAQTPPPASSEAIQPVPLEVVPPEPLNRISLSYRMGLNITANFKGLGGFFPTSNPGPRTGGAVDRTYDNGYSLVDVANNNHGPGFENTTWNWGYQNAGSIHDGQLTLSSSRVADNAVSKNNSDDPQNGVELSFDRELFRKDNWRFGVESAIGYTRISITDNRTLSASVIQTLDTYSIPNSVIIPPAPYNGTFQGPGAVIGSEPARQIITSAGGAIITGSRTLESDVFGLRLGPYAEVALNDKFSLLFSGGLYLAVGNSHFKFNETVTIPGVGSQTHAGSGSQTDYLIGYYGGANIQYSLTKEVALFVGAQFQSTGHELNTGVGKNSSTGQNGKSALLNLEQSVVVSIGASYSF
jgi:hypothetical protein